MKLEYVTIEKRGAIAVVRFDRKRNLNAFNEQLVLELTHAARSFHDDLETQVVALAGSPNAFSAGFDLKVTDSWPSETDDLKRRHRAYNGVRLCKAWEEMPQITIAAMERLAVGAGVAIALACDWRVLGRGAYLYVPEVKIGLNLQWGALPSSSLWLARPGPSASPSCVRRCRRRRRSTGVSSTSSPTTARLSRRRTVAAGIETATSAISSDADQSQVTAAYAASVTARKEFRGKS